MSVAAPSDFLDAKGVIVQVGQPVSVNGVPGVVRFAGTLPFAQGSWVGIELDRPAGKNNGSVKGVNYFECKPQHGIFVRPKDVVSLSPSSDSQSPPAKPSPSESKTYSGISEADKAKARQSSAAKQIGPAFETSQQSQSSADNEKMGSQQVSPMSMNSISGDIPNLSQGLSSSSVKPTEIEPPQIIGDPNQPVSTPDQGNAIRPSGVNPNSTVSGNDPSAISSSPVRDFPITKQDLPSGKETGNDSSVAAMPSVDKKSEEPAPTPAMFSAVNSIPQNSSSPRVSLPQASQPASARFSVTPLRAGQGVGGVSWDPSVSQQGAFPGSSVGNPILTSMGSIPASPPRKSLFSGMMTSMIGTPKSTEQRASVGFGPPGRSREQVPALDSAKQCGVQTEEEIKKKFQDKSMVTVEPFPENSEQEVLKLQKDLILAQHELKLAKIDCEMLQVDLEAERADHSDPPAPRKHPKTSLVRISTPIDIADSKRDNGCDLKISNYALVIAGIFKQLKAKENEVAKARIEASLAREELTRLQDKSPLSPLSQPGPGRGNSGEMSRECISADQLSTFQSILDKSVRDSAEMARTTALLEMEDLRAELNAQIRVRDQAIEALVLRMSKITGEKVKTEENMRKSSPGSALQTESLNSVTVKRVTESQTDDMDMGDLRELERLNHNLAESLDQAKTEIQSLSEREASAALRVKDLESKCSSLEARLSKMDALKIKASRLESSVATFETEIKYLQDERVAKDTRIKKLENELHDAKGEFLKLQTSLNQLAGKKKDAAFREAPTNFLDSYDSAMSRHCFLLQKQLVDKELKRFNKFSTCPDVPNVELISQHARVLQDLINGLPFSK